ncbi:MAG TPA: efflux transporter outer membrane subunit [Caulobacteraceae bacterium]|jgi:NodT family efflux transporter outer membrane factor (OMF) lipoprotein
MTCDRMRLPASLAGLTAVSLVLAGCAVGPDYKRPAALANKAPTPMAFKEADGWTQAAPSDAIARRDWWKVFNDPVLDDLEAKVVVSNQTLAQSEAAYRQALAIWDQQRASFFPSVTGTGSGTNSKSPNGFTTASGAIGGTTGRPIQTYTARLGLTWDVDVWGRIRRTVEAAKSTAQADYATLANATLSAQALMAADYFQLRADDEQKRILDDTVKGYAEDLRIAKNRFDVGVGARSDVLTAQSQLESAQASAVDIVRGRAQLEHAIAVLSGQAPSEVTIQVGQWNPTVPAVPVSLPSTLLERRPDIAAAERQMQAANAQIGVNIAAYFPDLSISGQYGFQAATLQKLFAASANSWSYGATLTQTIFDAGAISAKVRGARAAYDSSVANYRQTVLTAFQNVEDNIAALRVLQVEYDIDLAASRDADEAERIANNQYQAGQVDFTTVVVAQNTALAARRTVLQTASTRMTALVDLVQAFGGGWSATELAQVKQQPLLPGALIP